MSTPHALALLGLTCLPSLASLPAAIQDPATQEPATQEPAPKASEIPADTKLITLPSGLQYSILKPGAEGAETPRMGDRVTVHYTGWLTDGTKFDSSRQKGPLTTALGEVVEGWNEGLLYCPVGAQIKLTIPPTLGYGDKDSGPIPANSTLVFEVELLSIDKRSMPFVAWPTDEALIQRDAETGLAWHVIEPGRGEPLTGRTAVLDFALHNLGGGFVASSASQRVGQLSVGGGAPRFRFLANAPAHLREGARVLFNVPPDLAFGATELPNLPANSPSLWQVEVMQVAPAFELPSETELVTTASGLQYKLLEAGTGATPKPTSSVTAHYTGWLTNGTKFDSSWDRGQPIDFSLQGVVKGWTEGLQLVKEGGRILLVIPPALGYGAQDKGKIPPNSTLVFVVDLVKTN